MKNITRSTIFTLALLAAPAASHAAANDNDAGSGSTDDKTLTFKVKTAFVNDPVLFYLGTKIEARDGTVYLSGVVPDEKTKERLEKMPLSVAGVKAVKSTLAIKHVFVEKP